MTKKHISLMLALLLAVATAHAEGGLIRVGSFFDDLTTVARLGYGLGGSAPVGMPATIRKLNEFPLTPNLSFGVDELKPIAGGPWGVLVGVHFENKGMSTDATVKNYHMQIDRQGEVLEGVFTGRVVTKATEWMFTVPLQATRQLGKRVRLKVGPYVSYLTQRRFYGWAYNGYLRVDDPTGAKVELGEAADERGDYDFSSHMRRMQWGIDVGADIAISNRLGCYADLSWGLSGIHKSDFHTVEQTLYPIYGTVGITYKIR